ncbi:hypothetical protein MHK_001688, partial [Candidatus Magnetomorum sp. HK-1]
TDGSLGNWQETTSLPYAVEDHQCFTANGFVYCAGGYAGSLKSQVWYATLNTDGSLGNWQETTSLPYGVKDHQCFTANGFVYCAGGYAGNYKKDVLIYFNPFITMPTHPNENNWYITDKFSFQIADHVGITYGFYYEIGNSCSSASTNDIYTTERSFTFSSGRPVEGGVHYLNVAIADTNFIPHYTYCYRFQTHTGKIYVSSPTHYDQGEWYDNSTFHIRLSYLNSNLTYHYTFDDNPNTIPNVSSPIVDFEELVLVNQPPGTHYFHVQVFDVLGATGQPVHFRYNIYDSDEPKPAPLPVVTKLNVNPTSVTKDGTISIEGTIEIK